MTTSGDQRTTPRQPIIVIGMHRAGTSMLTRLLDSAGVYVGRRLTRNAECPFMNSLNYWVFEQSSANWDNPESVDDLLNYGDIRSVVTDYLGGVIDGPAAAHYLGLRRWLRHRSLHAIPHHWGWKDPRNTYTLPLWLDVFPNARVLHITRHGMDVAQSLRVRHLNASSSAIRRFQRRHWLYVNNPLAPKQGGFAHSPSVAHLKRGLNLWRAYTQRAHEHVDALGDQAHELRYEDLLAKPEEQLPDLLLFCGIEPSEALIQRLIGDIRASRRYAYSDNEELAAVARDNRETLQACGYDA